MSFLRRPKLLNLIYRVQINLQYINHLSKLLLLKHLIFQNHSRCSGRRFWGLCGWGGRAETWSGGSWGGWNPPDASKDEGWRTWETCRRKTGTWTTCTPVWVLKIEWLSNHIFIYLWSTYLPYIEQILSYLWST